MVVGGQKVVEGERLGGEEGGETVDEMLKNKSDLKTKKQVLGCWDDSVGNLVTTVHSLEHS